MALSIKILLALIALIELGFVLLGDSADPSLYRGVHLLQMLSLIAIVAVAAPPSTLRWLIMLALAISFLGDLVNSGLIDLSSVYSPEAFISMPFFLIAHLLYIVVFWRRLGGDVVLRVFPSLICVAVFLQIYSPDIELTAMIAVAVYGVVLFTMAFMALSFIKEVAPGPWVIAGAWLFVISDGLIAATLFSGLERSVAIDSAIWLSYIVAQIAISCVLLLPPSESPTSREAAL